MYTLLFISVCFILSFTISFFIKKRSNSSNKLSVVSNLFLIIIALGTIMINTGMFDSLIYKDKIANEKNQALKDSIWSAEYDSKHKIFREHGILNENVLSEEQLVELKEVLQHKQFKGVNFCDLYFEYLANPDKVITKYRDIKNIENILPFTGAALCKKESHKTIVSSEEIDNQFSSYDGSHKKLEEYVKNKMKNPDSYQHVESKYRKRDSYLEVVLTYRGANSFGAITTETVKAKCDLSTGEILEVL